MKVLNFGSCNIDYVYQMEHFIRPGETAPCTALSAGCGGKGLNQSIALAKAGTEVYHAGLYGAEGKFLLDKMQEAGVDTSLMRLGEGANGHAIAAGRTASFSTAAPTARLRRTMPTRSCRTLQRAMFLFCRMRSITCPTS